MRRSAPPSAPCHAPASLVLAVAAWGVAACADPTTPTSTATDAESSESTALAATAVSFHSLLRPQNEKRPGVPDPVINSVARASGRVHLNEAGQVEFTITVDNPNAEPFVAGHIHEAPVDQSGGIVVGFFGPPTQAPLATPITDTKFERTGIGDFNVPEAAALLERIRTHPENFYLNLHTELEPAGATRGQLGAGPRLDRLATVGTSVAAALGLPPAYAGYEMLQFRLRQSNAAGPWQVRVDWGDGTVNYRSLADLPFFGWFLHDYQTPGTYQIHLQGGLDIGPASEVQTAEIVVE